MVTSFLWHHGWGHKLVGPDAFGEALSGGHRLVVIDHQAGLHAGWTPAVVREIRKRGSRVIVIQHDTFETFGKMQERGFHDFRDADALIVHEEVEGLTDLGLPNVHFMRKGVLPRQLPRGIGDAKRPIVGTAGFAIAHKGQSELARVSAEAGWACMIIAHRASEDLVNHWLGLNPNAVVMTDFLPRHQIVGLLSACDATAWLYRDGDYSGTSGAIRLARRRLIAYRHRQFRDLIDEPPIRWVNDQAHATDVLKVFARYPGDDKRLRDMADLAERDGWPRVAARMDALYRELLDVELRGEATA